MNCCTIVATHLLLYTRPKLLYQRITAHLIVLFLCHTVQERCCLLSAYIAGTVWCIVRLGRAFALAHTRWDDTASKAQVRIADIII